MIKLSGLFVNFFWSWKYQTLPFSVQVFNDEWATSGGLTKRQLNDLEIDFLISIDWRLHVTPDEFEGMASTIEQAVAKKQIDKRNWKALTYTDLQVSTYI